MANTFTQGDVVYFADRGFVTVGVFDISFGGESYAYVDLVQLADHRHIDGVPIQEFHSDQEWRRLPKGWTYNTELFRVEDIVPKREKKRRKELLWTRPEDVKTGLKEGVLVLRRDVFHGEVRAEIDRHRGFRIHKGYPHWTLTYGQPNPDYRRVPLRELSGTFEEAQEKLRLANAEREKEAAMSDEEWSWKEIRRVLSKVDGHYAEECAKFIGSLPDIWDVEVKRDGGTVMWRRYEKRTQWEPIPVGCA